MLLIPYSESIFQVTLLHSITQHAIDADMKFCIVILMVNYHGTFRAVFLAISVIMMHKGQFRDPPFFSGTNSRRTTTSTLWSGRAFLETSENVIKAIEWYAL